jgi:predicted outer membrane repeat protein
MEKGGLVYIESRLQHEVPGDNTTPIITIETSPRFTNVHFEDSRVTARGGAVLLDVATNGLNPTTPFRYPAPLFEDCLFTGNRASDLGGAVYAGGGYGSMTTGGARAVFDDCRFEGNFAANGGGAVCVGSAVVELNNCLFTDNTLLEDWANGSAVLMANFISLSDLVMKNCTATGNVGQYTIFHNAGLGLGGSLRILNSIVWGNTSNTSFFQSIGDNGSFSSVDVEYSDIEMSSGIYPGMGNQNLNPFFQGDSFLDQVSSPCIDAGDPATAGAGRLHSKTTAQTAVNDLGLVDMGYHHAGGDNPRFYGVGNADYSGDRAWIDYSGAPVAGGTFIAQLRGARPNSTGVLLYGYAEDAKPISRGTLWVSLPSPMLLIRGDVDATGSLDMDLSSYIVSGQRVYLQFLYAKNLGAVGKRSFTDAMEVTVQ